MEYIQDLLFGKMSSERSAATEERISASSSKSLQKSSSRQPRCLRLKKEDGPTPTVMWETDGALLTELSTRNIGECPSVAVESTLSQILEANVHGKYSLSAKACKGILRRAERRGKHLPEMLRIALMQQIDVVGALNCMHDQQAVIIDRAFFNQGQNAQYDPQVYTDGTVPTIVAKGPCAVCVRYIVRRLTPTECARLQGFADEWGHPDQKEDFTDEEYSFWLNVRNTYAAINGKAVRQYTRQKMLAWYNKLYTDGAEYKMWGNGIALPCALYVMQGVKAFYQTRE